MSNNYNPESLPSELKQLNQWLVWVAKKTDKLNELGNPKITKIPHNPHNGYPASVKKSSHLSNFEVADDALLFDTNHDGLDYAGLGFVFNANGGYVGIDLDDCFDPDTRELKPWAREAVDRIDSFTELSPSKNGLHIIAKGSLPSSGHCDTTHGREMYDRDRYFTMTSDVFEGRSTIRDASDEINVLYYEWFSDTENHSEVGEFIWDDEAEIKTLDELKVSRRLQDIIVNGKHMSDYDNDKSKAIFFIVRELMNIGANNETILTILTDEKNFLSSAALDRRGNKQSAMDWLYKYNVGQARGEHTKSLDEFEDKTNDIIDSQEIYNEWFEKINNCESHELLESQIAPEIAQSQICSNTLIAAKLESVFSSRFKQLSTIKLPVAAVRKLLAPIVVASEHKHNWSSNWAYVENTCELFNAETRKVLNKEQFNDLYGREVRPDDDEDYNGPTPFLLAMHFVKMPIVEKVAYLPGFGPVVDNKDTGVQIGNSYVQTGKSLKPKDEWTDNDRSAIAKFEKHLTGMIEDDRDRNIIINWLGHRLRNPRHKARWSVVLQSSDGAGKGLIELLMQTILGFENCKSWKGSILEEKYTPWAEGAMMTIIDEVRISGANRFAIMDKIKPYITNDKVDVRIMQRDSFLIDNVTDYMFFTNHRDAIPANSNDRRYFIVFSDFDSREAIAKFVNDQGEDYFGKMRKIVTKYAGAIGEWLKDYPLHEDFDPYAPSPKSNAKTMMINLNKSDLELAIKDIIDDENEPFVNDDFISFKTLKTVLSVDEEFAYTAKEKVVDSLTKQLGYQRVNKRVRIEPEQSAERLYVSITGRFKGYLKNPKGLTKSRVDELLGSDVSDDDLF